MKKGRRQIIGYWDWGEGEKKVHTLMTVPWSTFILWFSSLNYHIWLRCQIKAQALNSSLRQNFILTIGMVLKLSLEGENDLKYSPFIFSFSSKNEDCIKISYVSTTLLRETSTIIFPLYRWGHWGKDKSVHTTGHDTAHIPDSHNTFEPTN